VGIGRDADVGVLQRFIDRPDIEPISANDPEQLVQMLRWASTVASRLAVVPESQRSEAPTIPVPRVGEWNLDEGEIW
jgi:hypothetical protein